MEDFSLIVKSRSDSVSFEGPIPLDMMITYAGKNEITILSDQWIDVEFEPPAGWTLKEQSGLRHLQGWLPTATLTTGQSLSRVLYIHDYFSSITSGRTKLPLIVKISQNAEAFTQPVVLRDLVGFTVLEPDPEGFADRIAEIHSQIHSQQSAEQRLELYRSVGSLSHPALIPLFLESLLDPAVQVFHITARRRAVEIAETHRENELLVKYLANHGSRYDQEFFRQWQERQVQLSDEEISQLCESSSLWTRLFCLEHFQQQYNRRGLLESLKTEVQELQERVKKLEDT
jgi:hypothetical protein